MQWAQRFHFATVAGEGDQKCLLGDENWTQTFFFLKLFGPFRDIPAKSRDVPRKKFGFPGFEGHTPLHVEDPHPTGGYPDPKVWVWVPFTSLKLQGVECWISGNHWGSPKASHIKASHPHLRHFPRFRVRIFRIFRVFRLFALRNLLRPLFFWGERDFPHFPHFPRIGFESLISKIRPTGFRMTGLRISGNHGNHGNDKNHGNSGCKPMVPQTTGLEIPEKLVRIQRQNKTTGSLKLLLEFARVLLSPLECIIPYHGLMRVSEARGLTVSPSWHFCVMDLVRLEL